jgi:hypothetical protein
METASRRQSATTRVWGPVGSAEGLAEDAAYATEKWDRHRSAARPPALDRRVYFTRNTHLGLKAALAHSFVYDHTEEYRACIAVDYTVKMAIALGLYKPFGYTNPPGRHNSGAFKGKIQAHVGVPKLNYPDVSEAEYSSILGPAFRGELAARAFDLVASQVLRAHAASRALV